MAQPAQRIELESFQLKQRAIVTLFDDFERGLDTTNAWNTTLSASATATAAAGVVTLTNAGTSANDEVYLFSRQALFTPAQAGGPTAPGNGNVKLEFFLQYTEANTNQVNLFAGIVNSVATGALVTSNGGVKTTGSAIGILKIGGQTQWRGHAHNAGGTSSSQEDLSSTTAGGTAYVTLGVHIQWGQGSTAEISYSVDGLMLNKNNDFSPSGLIKHTLDMTSFSAAQLCVLLRAGTTATNAESVLVDYASGSVVRPNLAI